MKGNIMTKRDTVVYSDEICVSCGKYLAHDEDMICKECIAHAGPNRSKIIMKNLHIENSYNIWLKSTMFDMITEECHEKYGSYAANKILNRTYRGMYIEWWLHNIGYWVTLPFVKNQKIKSLNSRFKHVDIEEHQAKNISLENK